MLALSFAIFVDFDHGESIFKGLQSLLDKNLDSLLQEESYDINKFPLVEFLKATYEDGY